MGGNMLCLEQMSKTQAPPMPPIQMRYRVVEKPDREQSYSVEGFRAAWLVPEQTMPESENHEQAVRVFTSALGRRVREQGLNARVCRNLGIHVDPKSPKLGFAPDAFLVSPAPTKKLESYHLHEHGPPRLVFEVVSRNNSSKDYEDIPAKCALSGVRELIVFDPSRHGPKLGGGPFELQVWEATESGFLRTHYGEGPAWSNLLGAWLVCIEGQLRIAGDSRGTQLWETDEEAAARERAARRQAEMERQQAEMERQQAEAARQQADTARQEAEAARQEAEAARQQADTARQEAEAEARLDRDARLALERELAALRGELGK